MSREDVGPGFSGESVHLHIQPGRVRIRAALIIGQHISVGSLWFSEVKKLEFMYSFCHLPAMWLEGVTYLSKTDGVKGDSSSVHSLVGG